MEEMRIAKTRVRVGLELSEEFEMKVGVHQGSACLPLLFAIVVDVITESVRNGLISEMLYVDDLVLTSESMEGLREKFWKWREAVESKGLKVNVGKTKVVVSGAEGEVTVSKVDPCGIFGKRVMTNSVLCVKCRKWIHGRCVKVKWVTLRLGRYFVCGRCKKEADEFMDSVEELCEEVQTVRGFCYLGDRVNAGGGCEAAVTARARISWVKAPSHELQT